MNKPLDIDKNLGDEYKFALKLLDEAHARARTPKQRRRIERKIQAVHDEYADLIAKGKAVDVAFQRWVAGLYPPKGTA